MQKISLLNLPVGICKIDHNKKMIYINKYFSKISGYPKEKLLGEHWQNAIHQEDQQTFLLALTESMQAASDYEFEFRFAHQENDVWVHCHLVPEKNGHAIVDYIGTITNITAFKKSQVALQQLAGFDPLTHLPNRYLFEDILIKSLMRSNRNKTKLALFYIDIDYFKNVNDFYGHGIGDTFLKEVGNRLKHSVRMTDFIVRLGGDEFAIIFEDIRNISAINQCAQQIIDEFQKPFCIGEHEISSTLSIGISVYPDEETNAETIVQHADQALYQAKDSGRNCYKYYNKSMQQQLERYMQIVKYLRIAIIESHFELYYQPKINSLNNSLVGIEALLRWNNPLVNASPSEFIPIAEDAGLVIPIGDWVIKSALRQYKLWCDAFPQMRDISISVNISMNQLNNSGIIDTVSEVLKETDIPTHNILFELTETAMMKKTLDSKSILQIFLTELGIGISIDDFGTGYSSLTYLKKLPIKELKIDKSFIDDIGINNSNEAIIKAIINLAKTLDLQVTAEGVETKEQLAFLQENHCNTIQGFYYSKPLSVSEMTSYITSMLGTTQLNI